MKEFFNSYYPPRCILHHLVVVALLLCGWLLLGGCQQTETDLETQIRTRLVQQYQNVNKLVLCEVALQKAVTLQDPQITFSDIHSGRDFLTWLKRQTQVGSRVGIYSFDATIVGYTDLSKISYEDISYHQESNTLTLCIAPIQMELRGRSFELRTDYEYVAPLRNAITPQDRAKVKQCAYERLQQEIYEDQSLRQQIRERSLHKLQVWVQQLLIDLTPIPIVQIKEQSEDGSSRPHRPSPTAKIAE